MNFQELEQLLYQTSSIIMSSPRPRMPSNISHPPAQSSASPLTPRQQFQAHVRTLSDHTSPNPANASFPPRPLEFQHVSGPRAQTHETSARPNPIYRFSDSTLNAARNVTGEPQFVKEEREAWSRTSPFRMVREASNDVYLLQPPEEESPVLQPSKPLRQYAPVSRSTDINERPKTSRGLKDDHSGSPTHDQSLKDGEDHLARTSKFAEGSMSQRSAGISSTWVAQTAITSPSATESDNEPTPRASPQHSSMDVHEFKPAALTPATTFKNRLFKFGSKAKAIENTAKSDAEPQPAKKKRALRKSMSIWNIGEKMKTFGASAHDLTPMDASPQSRASGPPKNNDLEVLDDRKRRAEEAYAQQFGTKRRKSNEGQVASSNEQTLGKTPVTADARPQCKPPTTGRRRSQSMSTLVMTDLEVSDSYNDNVDHHKRPTRRELEKENQQLRALLRQQEDPHAVSEPASPGRPLPKIPESGSKADPSPRKSVAKKPGQKPKGKDVPPVPPLPDRVALKTLSNIGNQNANKMKPAAKTNSNPNGHDNASSTKVSSADGNILRPVSVIFEEDEDGLGLENRNPSPSPGPKRIGPLETDMEKRKVHEHIGLQMKGLRREQWEWPDDVF